jgi:hypothetical protein
MNQLSESPKVVAHTTDGLLVKGSTQDFNPDRSVFRIVLPGGVETVPAQMSELKAVFFVKELDNTTSRPRQKDFLPTDGNRGNGRPVAVLFKDGELLVGYANSYNPERQGFFMLPADPADNNIRIFVVRSAVKVLKLGPAAEEFVRATNQSSEAAAA